MIIGRLVDYSLLNLKRSHFHAILDFFFWLARRSRFALLIRVDNQALLLGLVQSPCPLVSPFASPPRSLLRPLVLRFFFSGFYAKEDKVGFFFFR